MLKTMIKNSITLDYRKQEILATLPLRGKEEEFLSPNMDRGHMKFLKDLP
jgi:hypothetical protein